jgi:hypothetical protein
LEGIRFNLRESQNLLLALFPLLRAGGFEELGSCGQLVLVAYELLLAAPNKDGEGVTVIWATRLSAAVFCDRDKVSLTVYV